MPPTDPTVTIDHAMMPDVINAALSLAPIRHECNVCGKRHFIKSWVILESKQPTLYRCLEIRIASGVYRCKDDDDFRAWHGAMDDVRGALYNLNNVCLDIVQHETSDFTFEPAIWCYGVRCISSQVIKLIVAMQLAYYKKIRHLPFQARRYPAWFVMAPPDITTNTAYILAGLAILQSLQSSWDDLKLLVVDSLIPVTMSFNLDCEANVAHRSALQACLDDITSTVRRVDLCAQKLYVKFLQMKEYTCADYFLQTGIP